MARSMKTTKSVVKNENIDNLGTTDKKEEAPKLKKFEKDDYIVCHSIMAGKTFMEGIKTKNVYIFESIGATSEVEYQDLIAAVNVNSSYLFRPFIVVDDVDFIEQCPKLKKYYDQMYSVNDLAQILTLPPHRIVEEIDKLPSGAKQSIRSIVAEQVANGLLDSVSKIKAIDEYFGTQFMLLTGLYDN